MIKSISFIFLFILTTECESQGDKTAPVDLQREEKAEQSMFKAEEYYRLDSFRLALKGNARFPGFLKIIERYGDTKAGNLAHYYAGVCYLKFNDNKNAVLHFKKFTSDSKPVQARAYKLTGDAYADLGQGKNALHYYKLAAHENEEDLINSSETLYYAALIADRLLKDKREAILLYREMLQKYPSGKYSSQAKKFLAEFDRPVIAGAERVEVYVPLIKGKRVGVFANQTSMVGPAHLVDTLRKLGVDIRVIFGPEHGFRGTADAGEKIGTYTDSKTGIPVVSLYGAKRKPSAEDLKDIDVLIFDIQDVGVRFYTYISSLQEYMEAAFENSVPLLLLDRPNPNGFYVDGPVLDTTYRSFIGMQPVPVVYGMTIGEYAMMIAGERWLSEKANRKHDYYRVAQNSPDTAFHFLVIKNKNYDHTTKPLLMVKPSPNLPNMQSIWLYPSTCFFEGTVLSEGRGTDKQFQVFGHPSLPHNLYSFTPNPNEGAKTSKLYGKLCYGWDLSGTNDEVLKEVDNKMQLKWLINAYKLFPGKDNFFIRPPSGDMAASHFTLLAGNNQLWQQIKNGVPEKEIRKSWEPALSAFKLIRKKYLLYPDFE